MKICRKYILYGELSPEDIQFISGMPDICCEVSYIDDMRELFYFNNAIGKQYAYPTYTHESTVRVYSAEAETWLKLYFGDRLHWHSDFPQYETINIDEYFDNKGE